MGDRQPELVRRIKAELQNYPVTYEFGHGGVHPFVELRFAGKSEKVRYCFTADVGCSWYNTRSDLRKAARKLGADRVGALGHKLIEAAKPSLAELVFPTKPPEPPPERPLLDLKPLSELRPRSHQPQAEAAIMAAPALNGPGRAHTNGASKPEPQVSKLTNDECVAITRHIVGNTEDKGNGVLVYKPGWSDERILKILQATPGRSHLKLDNVTDLRVRSIGRLPAEIEKAARNGSETKSSLRALEARIAKLEADMDVVKGAVLDPTPKGQF